MRGDFLFPLLCSAVVRAEQKLLLRSFFVGPADEDGLSVRQREAVRVHGNDMLHIYIETLVAAAEAASVNLGE